MEYKCLFMVNIMITLWRDHIGFRSEIVENELFSIKQGGPRKITKTSFHKEFTSS